MNKFKFRTIFLIGLIVITIPILTFIFSTYMYQRLVNEGQALVDKECMNVNPLIIQRKNSYLETVRIIKTKGIEDEYWKQQKNYLDISEKYIKAQKNWLKEQKQFMNSIEYKLFFPSFVQKEELLQYQLYEAEMKIIEALKDSFYALGDNNKIDKLDQIMIQERKKRDVAENALDDLLKSQNNFDPRIPFIRAPRSTCPEENWNIPDVPGFIELPKPINYDLTS